MKTRNQALDIVKLIGACFVIFIHIRFAGDLGKVMECLARFAVPFFFASAGYFCFRQEALVIKRRMWRILKILAAASAVYLIWGMISLGNGYNTDLADFFAQRLTVGAIARFLFLDCNPFGGHLWFLSALFFTYLLFFVYVSRSRSGRELRYRPLYFFGAFALLIHIILSTGLTAFGISLNYIFYRNTWLFAVPMFLMGIFLHEYQENIRKRITPVLLGFIVLAGAGVSLLQRFLLGPMDLPLGTIPETAALLLLVTEASAGDEKSQKKKHSWVPGRAPLFIYVMHPLYDGILRFCFPQSSFLFGKAAGYYYPLLILVVSVVLGIFLALLAQKCGKMERNNKTA